MLPKIYDNNMPAEFNRLFDDMFDGFFNSDIIRSDVLSGDDNTLCIDVPGFNSENLDVNYYNGMIIIEGKNEKSRSIKKYIKLSKFQREPISADIKDGVLTLIFDEQASGKKKINLKKEVDNQK